MLLRFGSRGQPVAKLQQMINAMGGLGRMVTDGIFGHDTDLAVRRLQKKLHLPADGVVGPKTLTAIAGPVAPLPGAYGPQALAFQLLHDLGADGVTKPAVPALNRLPPPKPAPPPAASPLVQMAASSMPRRDFALSKNFTAFQLTRTTQKSAKGVLLDNWPTDPVIFQRLEGLCRNVLEVLHAKFGPITVNSGYRSKAVNDAVGSSEKSNHRKGYAADIEISGMDNRELALWVRDNMTYKELLLEFHHVGAPDSGWVHVAYAIDAPNVKKTGTITKKGYAKGIA